MCVKGYIKRDRAIVFAHYGNRCACCGETTEQFLTVDHINNNGRQHRKETNLTAGCRFYRWIIKAGFPTDLRLLCWNCNCGRRMNGGVCPHEQKGAPAGAPLHCGYIQPA